MTIVLLLTILASPSPQPAAAVALAYAASGGPTLRAPGGSPRRIADVARVEEGMGLEVPPGAVLRLALTDGRRFAFKGPAFARVTSEGLLDTRGTVEPLPAVPSLPRLPTIQPAEAGDRIAAIRLRSDPFGKLTPDAGAVVLAEEVVLRFAPPQGTTTYAIEVRDASGRSILARNTTSTVLQLPMSVLEAGRRYSWTVEAIDIAGARHRSLASFSTLAEDLAQGRARVRQAVGTSDPALLDALDRALGLLPLEAEGHVADGH